MLLKNKIAVITGASRGIGMTLSWAKEFSLKGGNVRVNAVAPGYTMSDMMKTVPENPLEKFRGTTMLVQIFLINSTI